MSIPTMVTGIGPGGAGGSGGVISNVTMVGAGGGGAAFRYSARQRTMKEMLDEVQQANPHVSFEYGLAHESHAYRLIARTSIDGETFVVEQLIDAALLDAQHNQVDVMAATLSNMTHMLDQQIADQTVPNEEARALCTIAGVKPKYSRESHQFGISGPLPSGGLPHTYDGNMLFIDHDAPMDTWRDAITAVVRAREVSAANPDLEVTLGGGIRQKFQRKIRPQVQVPDTFVSKGAFYGADFERMMKELDKSSILAQMLEVEEAKRRNEDAHNRMLTETFGAMKSAISSNLQRANAANQAKVPQSPPKVMAGEAAPIPKSVYARLRKVLLP